MSLCAVIVEAALPQSLVAALDARARRDHLSREVEIRAAVVFWLAYSTDQGELRHPDDIAVDFEQHLPADDRALV